MFIKVYNDIKFLLQMTESTALYTLVSSDNVEFKVSDKILGQSEVFKHMMNVCDDTKKIPVSDIDGQTLDKIIRFCEHYEKDSPYVPPSGENPDRILPSPDSWDMQFLLIPHDDLSKVIVGANYLDIPRLIDCCCDRLGLMVQGRSVEELRKIFDIQNDFTPDEEKKMKRECT
ncbi:hypothetical protein FO519_000878 [Halicephalobus sp. NKZ332]|nr:hypothetical protein FO519_000878 [Halicephalobus sp. NKZ332]